MGVLWISLVVVSFFRWVDYSGSRFFRPTLTLVGFLEKMTSGILVGLVFLLVLEDY